MSMRSDDPTQLFAEACSGDRGALARVLSFVERGGVPAREIARLASPRVGRAYVIGITGAPGAGKSTLTSALIGELRSRGGRVGVLAIDPSSPYTGGAILGDRVRMQDHSHDHNVYIRSMATRGHLGGLALATSEAIRVLDATGHDWVLVETVGVGQVEVEIAGKADTTIVVVNPGWGDAVQANKAGLLEIADVFVINKADRDGVEGTRRDLQTMLELTEFAEGEWQPSVTSTVATTKAGVTDVIDAVLAHRAAGEASGDLLQRRRLRRREELREIIERRLEARARELCSGDRWDNLETRVTEGEIDPWSAADEMLRGISA
jgi:LAO/AO transport system kinase